MEGGEARGKEDCTDARAANDDAKGEVNIYIYICIVYMCLYMHVYVCMYIYNMYVYI